MKRNIANIETARGASASGADECSPARASVSTRSRFMSVKQLAEYLQINEKKVYALANDGRIPGTKITGKWLFARELVDQWLLESSHGGVLTDRLVLAGSDDPLLHRVVSHLAAEIGAQALISYTCTGTALGLGLLARRRADACAIHWGPAEESLHRHPALLRQYAEHPQWLLVRMFHRQQGLMLSHKLRNENLDLETMFDRPLRWIMRQPGAGSQRFLQETMARFDFDAMQLAVVGNAHSEREAASLLAAGRADVAPGTEGAAGEFGIGFLPIGWEAFDLALPRAIYFRALFQRLVDKLRTLGTQDLGQNLGGYDFTELGRLVWTP